MKEIKIIQVSINDIINLQVLAQQAYSETFGPYNTKENLEAYLVKAFSTEQLTIELTEQNSQWYIAFAENEIMGFLKVNFGKAQTELQDDNAMEIERLYVLQQFQGNKIGWLLMDKAISIANKNNVGYVWLGVWEKNMKALNFYKKQGFKIFDQHSFFVGEDEQTDWMMKLTLKDATESVETSESS